MAGYNRPGSSYRRPGARRTRRAANPILPLIATVALVVMVISAALIAKGCANNADAVQPASGSGAALLSAVREAAATATPVPTPTPEPTSEPTPAPAADYGATLPSPTEEGYLPIISKASTDQKVIAITVDDCFQFKNTRTITDLILSTGGNFTLFPIGKNVLREELYDTLHYCYNNGVQIENHTYEHRPHYNKDDELMARQVYMQKACVDYILGVDYQQHFFRPMGGDGRDDQRLHIYCKQLGIKAIAWWSVSGSDSSIEKIAKSLAPGQVYLFHTTDSDLAKLQQFIPYAVEQGYKLVTLNELFGLPANEVKPLDGPVEERDIPQIGAYTLNPRTYKKGDYAWMAYLIQNRLIELGYLEGEPDGIYGAGTADAVADFQKDNGIEPTGKADPATQAKLFDGKDPLKLNVATTDATSAPDAAPEATPAPEATAVSLQQTVEDGQ